MPHSRPTIDSRRRSRLLHSLTTHHFRVKMHGMAAALATAITVGLSGLATYSGSAEADTSSNVVAYGHVLDAGNPVTGANVVAFAWPKSSTLANLADGAEVPLLKLGSVSTDSTGQFTIPADPATVPARYFETDGNLSVEITASDPTRQIQWNYSVQHLATAAAPAGYWALASSSNPTAAAPGPEVELDLGGGTASDAGNEPATWVDDNGSPLSPSLQSQAVETGVGSAQSDTAMEGPPICYYIAGDWHHGLPEHFANVYNYTGAKGTVEQNLNITHTLGVGASSNGYFTDTKVDGTASIVVDNGTGAGASQSGILNKSIWDRMNYRDFHSTCPFAQPAQRRPVSAFDFLTVDLFRSVIHQYYRNCGSHGAGGSWYTTTAHQVTFAFGTDIGPISVSAQSGFGQGTKLGFSFSHSSDVCGNSPNGPLSSPQVDAEIN